MISKRIKLLNMRLMYKENQHRTEKAADNLRSKWYSERNALLNVRPNGSPISWSWPMWLSWLVAQSVAVEKSVTIAVIGANPECITDRVAPDVCKDIMYRFLHTRRPSARVLLVDADSHNLDQALRGYKELGPNITVDAYNGALTTRCGSWNHDVLKGKGNTSTPCCPTSPQNQSVTFWQSKPCTRKSHLPWLTGVGKYGCFLDA